MSANMFAALSEDPVAAPKAAAAPAAAQAKTAQKSVVGGSKKTDAPKGTILSSAACFICPNMRWSLVRMLVLA